MGVCGVFVHLLQGYIKSKVQGLSNRREITKITI